MSDPDPGGPPRPKRMLRVSKACDYCHRRRIKCRVSQSDPERCQNCVDFSLECESSRPLRRGKAAASNRPGCLAHASIPATPIAHDNPTAAPTHTHTATTTTTTRYGMAAHQPQPPPAAAAPHRPPPQHQHLTQSMSGGSSLVQSHPPGDRRLEEGLSPAWKAFAYASAPLVRQLLAVYFETVYPIFPLFDRDNLERRLSCDEHLHARGFFCSIMAACALAAARVRDGAIVSPASHPHDLASVPPETFFAAAQDTLPADLLRTQDFDCLRACALLGLASVQDGKIDAMRMYIGHYFTMTATWQWHDEANWPRGLLPIDLEERRRLYWSIYTLDIFTSTVWDGCAHFQEAHARVEYPSGAGSNTTGTTSTSRSPGTPPSTHWLVGWNFTTDLYRILEHALGRLRTRSSRFNFFNNAAGTSTSSSSSLSPAAESAANITEHVNALYASLPPSFRDLRPATGNLDQDIFGFQAANIRATLALLRMALLSLDGDVDLDKKCSVASDVLSTFHQVPRAFQRAISTPLIYHIGGIGNILGSVMGAPLSESSYQRVRTLLLSMADLLESLESFLHQRAGAGRRLREQVERIDAYMVSRRQMIEMQQQQQQQHQQQQQQQHQQHSQQQQQSILYEDMPVGGDDPGANGINGISPLFQIPDELLQHWDWGFNPYGYQSQFPYFIEPG